MSNFFQDYFNIKRMFQKKREYKQFMARVEQLPADYVFVFKKIQTYMWQFAAGAGYDMMALQQDLVELFESGAASGKDVLEITGSDVAGFVEELLKNTRTYTEDWKKKFNLEIQNELKKS